jgi:hypothetical protein
MFVARCATALPRKMRDYSWPLDEVIAYDAYARRWTPPKTFVELAKTDSLRQVEDLIVGMAGH